MNFKQIPQQMSTPFFSVVIPTYNHAEFLEKALCSVMGQTFQNWEAIVVDNHSDDETEAVLGRISDPRINVMKIHNHGVIAASRNMGMQSARGEWIAFLDSDDFWYPQKLEVMAQSISDDQKADVHCADEYQVSLETGKKKRLRYGPYCADFYRTLLVSGNRLSPSSTVVRRERLCEAGLYFCERKDFVAVEDYDFWLRLASAGMKFKFVRLVLGEFVVHSRNCSSNAERLRLNAVSVLYDHVYNLQEFQPNKGKLWRDVNCRIVVSEIKDLCVHFRLLLAFRRFVSSFLSSPIMLSRHIVSYVVRVVLRLFGI